MSEDLEVIHWESGSPARREDRDSLIILNVRGVRFYVKLSALEMYPTTEMAKIAKFYIEKCRERTTDEENKNLNQINQMLNGDQDSSSRRDADVKMEFYVDKDPVCFSAVLHYLETGHLHYPSAVCAELFRADLAYWNIPELAIEECCINQYTKILATGQALKYFSTYMLQATVRARHVNLRGSTFLVWRRKIWKFMTYPTSSLAARNYSIVMSVLIIMSVIVIMWQAETMSGHTASLLKKRQRIARMNRIFHRRPNVNDTHMGELICPEQLYLIFGDFPLNVKLTLFMDTIFTCLFMVETLVRLLSAPSVRAVVLNVGNYVDLAALLPYMYVMYVLIMHYNSVCVPIGLRLYRIVSTIRIARIYRLIYTISHHDTFRGVIYTIKSSLKEFAILFALVGIVTIISGSLASLLESAMVNDQDSTTKLANLRDGMWWALITLTTVGYGDVVPIFWPTKLLTVGVALMGISVIALATPIVASNFDVIYNYMAGRKVIPAPGQDNQGLQEDEEEDSVEETGDIRENGDIKANGDVKSKKRADDDSPFRKESLVSNFSLFKLYTTESMSESGEIRL